MTVERLAADIIDGIERVIVGKRAVAERLVVALFARGHVLLDDVPGTGKTMMARAMAASTGLRFKRIQCTPDLLPGDVTGVNVFDPATTSFRFRPGPVFTDILLADEVNRATPRTQAALLEAMQETQVTVDGETRGLGEPFMVIATQNPVEFEGTFPLPEAQLDRFLMSLRVGYPSGEEEAGLVARMTGPHPVESIEPVVDGQSLVAAFDEVDAVHIAPEVAAYVVELVQRTRSSPALTLGASTRASLALASAARALASLRGRDFVLPDDIKELAPSVLAHRLIVDAEARLRGMDAGSILEGILEVQPVAGFD